MTIFEVITDHGLLKLQNFEELSQTLLMGFLVVPIYRKTVENENLDTKRTLKIVKELLKNVEKLHDLHYILNNFSLDNLIVT